MKYPICSIVLSDVDCFFTAVGAVTATSVAGVIALVAVGDIAAAAAVLTFPSTYFLSKICLAEQTQTSFSALFYFLSLTDRKHYYFPPS